MLSIIAICILTVSGHSHSRSHSHDHHKHGSHSHSHDHDINQHHQHHHEHDHHNSHSHSHSSDNNGKTLHNKHEQEIRHKTTGEPYHKCSSDHHKIVKGKNLKQIEIPYDNHPYADAVKKTKLEVLEELKNKIPSDIKNVMDPIFGHKQDSSIPRSLLTDAEADAIRITAHYDSSVTQGLTTANQNWLKQTISAAINYYESFVQVIPVSGTWFFDRCNSWWTNNGYRTCANYATTSYCQNSPVPADHYGDLKIYTTSGFTYSTIPGGNGIVDTDLVLYVSFYATSSCSAGALAHAGPCAYDQYGRPVAGNINVCSSFFSSLNWRGDVQTMLHEMTHITIMVSSLWDSFRDPSTGGTLDFYNDVYQYDSSIQTGVIKSPEVKSMAQNHFGCTTNALKGLPLTNYSSHWHTKWAALETMNPTSYGPMVFFSKWTLALMKDSGWYYIDYEYAQPFYFGENAGCGIMTQDCINLSNGNSRFDFCDDISNDGCTTDYSVKGQCFFFNYGSIPTQFQYFGSTTSGGPDDSDYCPFIYPYSNTNRCIDSDGLTSRCTKRTSSSGQSGTCLPHNCINYAGGQYGGVEITVNSQTITCLVADAGTTKTVSGADNIICPEVDRVCGSSTSSMTCYNGHYSSVHNKCICQPGYKGNTCNVEDSANAAQNDVQLAVSREPTSAPTDPPSTVCFSGFGSYSTAFNGEWVLDTAVGPSVYNGKGVYYKSIGSRASDDRRVWWNAFYREYKITRTAGASSTYCQCFGGSEDYDISACNGNWECYESTGYELKPAATITVGSCGGGSNTPSPVTTTEAAVYCESIKSVLTRRRQVTSFNEANDGQAYLDAEVNTALGNDGACTGDSSTADYYYDFVYRANKDLLIIKIDLCCHATDANAMINDNTYTAPNRNYQRGGTGAAFTGGDEINLEDGIGTKEIIVFVIIGIIVISCIIILLYFGKKMYDKKSKSKADAVELTHKGSKITNTPTPVADTEFPNTTR